MIYFIQSGCDGPIKIGYTNNDYLQRRIANMQAGNPEDLTLLKAVEGNLDKEKELQERFNHLHRRGEWFWPTTELTSFVANLNGFELEAEPEIREPEDADCEFSLSELAEYFDLEHSALRRSCREGRIEARKAGRIWLSTQAHIAHALEQGSIQRHAGRPQKKTT